MSRSARDPSSRSSGKSPRFLVIGAGMSGILTAIQLDEAGYGDYVLYEKADTLGGTWRENTYPGIACDVPSHFYSYSFALNPEWSRRFAPGAEIRAYFEEVAKRFGVYERIRFGREVTRARFEQGRWCIELDDGTTDEGDFVVAATGVLHHPNIPAFEGMQEFEGAVFHSARWDHSIPLEGRRVGVVGTGSTAIQIVSALVEQVASLKLFQRTAQWVMPVANETFSEAEKAEFRTNADAMEAIRREVATQFADGFANILVDADSPLLQAMQQACQANLDTHVQDETLKAKLTPGYRAACKRLIMSPDFYQKIQHPNARLVTEGIGRLEKSGIRTRDGELHELDVLVLATGFRVDQFVRPMEVTGRDGVLLDEVWRDGPFAYMAISVPDFPNFFMLNGPNSPVGNFSLIDVAERQVAYILQLVDRVQAASRREVAPGADAMARFDEERREAAATTIWASGCSSWYIGKDGLPTAWPWTFDRFREEMRAPRFEDYELL